MSNDKSNKDYAREFVSMGIGVIPLKPRDKRPNSHMLPKDDQGNVSWSGYVTALPSDKEISMWFPVGTENYGVVMGWQNLVVIDFDDQVQYTNWMHWCTERWNTIARGIARWSFRVITGRGVHVYIRTREPMKRTLHLNMIDVKGNGYVVGPGSVHPTGAIYTSYGEMGDIRVVNQLSDILPSALLVRDAATGLGKAPGQGPDLHVTHVANMAKMAQTDDPWRAIDQVDNFPRRQMVKRVKDRWHITDLVPAEVKSSNDGRYWLGRCPLHDDSHPSFWIDTQEQLCGCFAGCNDKPMDVINLFARMSGIDNSEAIMLMAEAIS